MALAPAQSECYKINSAEQRKGKTQPALVCQTVKPPGFEGHVQIQEDVRVVEIQQSERFDLA